MFHVVDHTRVVFSGDLSKVTRYIIERYGTTLDTAIQSGLRILYTDSLHELDVPDADKIVIEGDGLQRNGGQAADPGPRERPDCRWPPEDTP